MVFDDTQSKWITQALERINKGDLGPAQTAKALRVISQLFEQKAQEIETEILEKYNEAMSRNYQDHQNQKLVDILSR